MNYNDEMERIIASLKSEPKLLLHVCCAPCSSATLERLVDHFKISLFFYNPNIDGEEEYNKRLDELKRFVKESGFDIDIIERGYNQEDFLAISKERSKDIEGGKSCFACYKLRLDKTASVAAELDYDYFTTTLSISPYKNSLWINEIGAELASKYNIKYLYADLKKKNGYKRSIELSEKYKLYRQNYCGCIYSKREYLQKKDKLI